MKILITSLAPGGITQTTWLQRPERLSGMWDNADHILTYILPTINSVKTTCLYHTIVWQETVKTTYISRPATSILMSINL